MKSSRLLLLRALISVYCFYVTAAAFQAKPITRVPASSSRGQLSSTLVEDEDVKARTVWEIGNDNKERKWFPIHPADALSEGNNYNTLVRSAYVRHIKLATEDLANLVMRIYSKGGGLPGSNETYDRSDADLFSRLAADLSLCSTKEDGGEVGWVENPLGLDRCQEARERNEVVSGLMSNKVIEALFAQRVKGGDVVKVKGDDGAWHLVRCDDIFIQVDPSSMASAGTKNVINRTKRKLKGSGKVSTSPAFVRRDADGASIPLNIGLEDDNTQSKTIYSVPDAKHYKIVTTGCQMNVADSERIMGVLEGELGLKSIESERKVDPSLLAANQKSQKVKLEPDVLLLNTCTIRDHAEQKVYDAIGPYAAMKRNGRPLAIVVAGCVAQQEGDALLRRFPEIDLVLGPQYIPWLGELLIEVGKGAQLCMTDAMVWSEKSGGSIQERDSTRDKDADWQVPIKRGHSTRAWVNVIYGCNEHCTYCVVPGVRGVEQSRSMEAILQECLKLAEAGYKEVTLLGQNIDAYGRDMTPRRNFADLLYYLNDNIPDGTISRIRYVTSHPRYFSDRVIDAVANLDKVCECFHMPFQAGDDKVLKEMRRGYTFDSYMNIIRKIKEKAPDASICGDVIVGFPGETEEEFQRTLDLMNEVHFDNLNTFAYSPRPNTEAALWKNQVPPEVSAERLQRVQKLANEHALERSQRYLGKIVEVLVEDRNPKNREEVMGRTRQGRQVFFKADIGLAGKLVDVKITEAGTWSLLGELQEVK